MALQPTPIGENPFQPYVRADTFIPDQLIAGNEHLVSDNWTISGASPLKRGTVLGRSQYAALTQATGKTFASGTVTVAGAGPVAGDTITVNGTVLTAAAPSQFQPTPPAGTFYIGSTIQQTAQNLGTVLTGSTDANISKMTYTVAGAVITATSTTPGTGGNAFTLATSNPSAFTLSGATLSGGTANAGTATMSGLSAGAQTTPGNYSVVLTSATAFNVFDPTGDEIGQGTMGTPFVNPQLNFTITTGGAPAAGDAWTITAAPVANLGKICVTTATDGSDAPSAILADDADPSAGAVNAGVYLKGEFNARAVILDPSLSLPNAKTLLRPLAIYLKDSVSAADPF